MVTHPDASRLPLEGASAFFCFPSAEQTRTAKESVNTYDTRLPSQIWDDPLAASGIELNMRIRLGCAESDIAYIRHARSETLKAIHVEPTPEAIEPLGVAQYLFAYDDDTGEPIGMTETALMRDVFSSYDDGPQFCDLNQFCPFEEMASIRTIYVHPAHRNGMMYLRLSLAASRLCYERGGRFGTATTNNSDEFLKSIYRRSAGTHVGNRNVGDTEIALFVFDLEELMSHRAYQRLSRSFEFLGERPPIPAGSMNPSATA